MLRKRRRFIAKSSTNIRVAKKQKRRRSSRNIGERQRLRRCAFGLERDSGEISPSARARGSAPAQGAHSWSATKPEGNERYVSSALKRISEKPGRVDGALLHRQSRV